MTVDVVYFNYFQNPRFANKSSSSPSLRKMSRQKSITNTFSKYKFVLSILNDSNCFLLFYLVNSTLCVQIEIIQCLILQSSDEASGFVRFWEERANRGFEYKLNLKTNVGWIQKSKSLFKLFIIIF